MAIAEPRRYRLTPQDPLVFGDGRPLERLKGNLWPVPATLAAAINGWLGARDLRGAAPRVDWAQTALRGPLLDVDGGLFVPPPADALLADGGWVGGRFLTGEATRWPEGFPAGLHVHQLDERDKDGRKRKTLETPVPWGDALDWALGRPVRAVQGPAMSHTEARMHVAIDSGQGTAVEGALFSTRGVRLRAGASYLFTWAGRELPAGRVAFGGEGRTALLEPVGSERGMASEAARSVARAALLELLPKDGALLRVQLLSPALFDPEASAGGLASLPAWLRPGRGCVPGTATEVQLFALRIGRTTAFSGWKSDWRTGAAAPRPIRQLVPAGGVYWLCAPGGGPLPREHLLALWDRLWLAPLDGAETPASRLGFGLVLPGFTTYPQQVTP